MTEPLKLTTRRDEAQAEVVALLKDLLQQAEEGQIRSLLVAYDRPDAVGVQFRGEGSIFTRAGLASIAQAYVTECWGEQRDAT